VDRLRDRSREVRQAAAMSLESVAAEGDVALALAECLADTEQAVIALDRGGWRIFGGREVRHVHELSSAP
jgi:hypothetical protein